VIFFEIKKHPYLFRVGAGIFISVSYNSGIFSIFSEFSDDKISYD